jgi:peptidoglycan/LPS O-acetylase OafA/YrhL
MLAFDLVNHWMVRYFPAWHAQLPSHLGLVFLRFFVAMGLAVGAAFVSRRYFEEWFLGLKDRWTRPSSNSPPQPSALISEPEQRTA